MSEFKFVKGITPQEAYFDKEPSIAHFKKIGCDCYVHVPNASSWSQKASIISLFDVVNNRKCTGHMRQLSLVRMVCFQTTTFSRGEGSIYFILNRDIILHVPNKWQLLVEDHPRSTLSLNTEIIHHVPNIIKLNVRGGTWITSTIVLACYTKTRSIKVGTHELWWAQPLI